MQEPELVVLLNSGCSFIAAINSPAGWKIRRNGHSESEHIDIFFVQKGIIEGEYEGGKFVAKPGDVLIVPSWVDRCLSLPESGEHLYFRFDNPNFYPMIQKITIHQVNCIEPLSFYLRMLLVNSQTLSNESAYRIALVELINIHIQRELRGGETGDHVNVTRFLHLLQNKPLEHKYKVGLLARKFGMSISGLRKFCLKELWSPPGDLIEEFRMTNARALLHGNMTIDDIAEILAFANRFTFSKAFKKHQGMSPGKFRQKPMNHGNDDLSIQ